MLVLSRKVNEQIRISDNIVITVVQIGPGKVRLGVQAPKEITVLREELVGTLPHAPVADQVATQA